MRYNLKPFSQYNRFKYLLKKLTKSRERVTIIDFIHGQLHIVGFSQTG